MAAPPPSRTLNFEVGMGRALVLSWIVALAGCAVAPTPQAEEIVMDKAPEAAPEPGDAPVEQTPEARARRFVALIAEGQGDEAFAMMDDTMKRAMPPEGLVGLWGQLRLQAGDFEGQGAARQEALPGYEAVLVRCTFERGELDIKVVLDAELRVAGLFVLPPKEDLPQWQAPAYADPSTFEEREVEVGAAPWVLPGTLTIPKGPGPHPAVVLVHGSGPNDRDETIGPNKPFKDLAWGLATRGIAVLRYDKRTRVHSGAMAGLAAMTVNDESVDDALAAVERLRAEPQIDAARIAVLGHSLGATVIPRIGARDARIHALVAMAPLARPLEDAMVDQYTYIFGLDGALSDLEAEKLEEVKADRARVKALKAGDGGVLGAPASYWLDLRDYKPHEAARALKGPLLVLQGERDYQVTVKDDFALWQAALAGQKGATLKVYPGLNHLFIAGEGPPRPAEYGDPGHVAEVVIDDVAAWLRAR